MLKIFKSEYAILHLFILCLCTHLEENPALVFFSFYCVHSGDQTQVIECVGSTCALFMSIVLFIPTYRDDTVILNNLILYL